jgi:hypothetical protein
MAMTEHFHFKLPAKVKNDGKEWGFVKVETGVPRSGAEVECKRLGHMYSDQEFIVAGPIHVNSELVGWAIYGRSRGWAAGAPPEGRPL